MFQDEGDTLSFEFKALVFSTKSQHLLYLTSGGGVFSVGRGGTGKRRSLS